MQNYLFNINHNLKLDHSSNPYTRMTFTLLFTFHDYFPKNSLNKVQNFPHPLFANNAK